MKLSDRLVEAKFTKTADGNWEYSPFPFQRCRLITEEQKTALAHNLKLINTGLTLFTFAVLFKFAVIFPMLLILALAAMSDKATLPLTRTLFAIPVLPPLLAILYTGFELVRANRSKVKVNTLNAERGRRVGYAEHMKRTGHALGPVYTLLIVVACASALVFSAILGSLMRSVLVGSVLDVIIGPAIITSALLPLFWAGLRSPEQASA